MNAHYVYILKNKDDGRLYIGDRTAPTGNPKDDIKYKSSCKVVPKEYKQNCMKRILKTFETREEAKAFEIYLHNKYEVGTSPRFFNGAKQTSTKFSTKGITPSHTKTKEWSDKCKQFNATRTYKSTPHLEETKKRISKTWKKKYAEGYKPTAKSKHSDESKQLMSLNSVSKGKTGATSMAFKPWFIKYPDSSLQEFHTISKKEKSLEDGLPPYAYEQICTRSKGITPVKQGRLKGYIIGNL